MVVAVPYENGEIFQHYGQSGNFKLYEYWDGKLIDSAVVTAFGEGHEKMALFLQEYNVDALICGGIGDGACMALADAGIQIYAGVSGCSDESVEKFIAGTLQYEPGCSCSHHHEDGHGCCCGHDHEESQGCGCGHQHGDCC